MAVNPPGRDELRTPSRSERTYTVTFGRTLVDGRAVGDGVTLPVDSPTLALLQRSATPLVSNPVFGEYRATLVRSADSNGEYEQLLIISLPGNVGLPEHAHPTTEEHVEVVEGVVVVDRDGDRRTLRAGESMTVEPGTAHTVRNESDVVASHLVEIRPADGVEALLTTLGGLAHDGKLRQSGEPTFPQALIGGAVHGTDTAFTTPPPVVQRILARVFASVSRRFGYPATEAQYDDAFWVAHVEQPPDLRWVP